VGDAKSSRKEDAAMKLSKLEKKVVGKNMIRSPYVGLVFYQVWVGESCFKNAEQGRRVIASLVAKGVLVPSDVPEPGYSQKYEFSQEARKNAAMGVL
jgi:hypothetical protein